MVYLNYKYIELFKINLYKFFIKQNIIQKSFIPYFIRK
jgi:hypothetical protein